MSINAC